MTQTTGELLDIEQLARFSQKPALFEPGDVLLWADPYVAQRLLDFHLNPDVEAASRPPAKIDAESAWIVETLGLKAGDSLLDLGCGPGLYCQRFSARGLAITGVDLSGNSLAYAREHTPAVTFIHQNYTSLELPAGQFDAVTLIFGDFCVLEDGTRDALLDNVRRWLRPGGHFVLDVTTRLHHLPVSAPTWSLSPEGGFWKPGPHLTLEMGFDYPEHDTSLEQYIVIEADGTVSIYRDWFHDYSAETITALLNEHGFRVVTLRSDLSGAPLTPDTRWVGVVAQRM